MAGISPFREPLHNLLDDAKKHYGETHSKLQCYGYNDVREEIKREVRAGTFVYSDIYNDLGTDIAIILENNFDKTSLNRFLKTVPNLI